MPKSFLAALLVLPAVLLAQPQTTPENDRLVATGKLWTTVKYFHPYLGYRDIDWDTALVDALPKIRAASSSKEYAAALQSMLDALHDPATYAMVDGPNGKNASLKLEKTRDGTLIVSQAAAAQPADADARQQLAQAITSAIRVLIDLRVAAGAPEFLSGLLEDDSVSRLLSRTAVETPAQRTWVHRGLPPQSPLDTDYHTAFYIKAGTHIEGSSAAPERGIAFVLNENSPLPHIGCALWAEGKATVLAESPHFQFADVKSAVIPMGQGVQAIVRVSEPVISREVKAVSHDAAIPQALAAIASTTVRPPAPPLASAPSPRADLAYGTMRYPSTEYRILAAYKIWAAVRNFFAYRELMDEDWDDVFTAFLPKFIAAKDARDYNLTVAEMVTHVADSHASVFSEELTNYFGQAPVGLRLRLIEKKPVVTEVLDENAAKLGIHPGDIVTRVDGENITDRFQREARYVAASTQQSLGYQLLQRILNGPDGSTASLTIEAPDGRPRDVNLKRSSIYTSDLAKQRSGDVLKLLPGNLGYADLDRLVPDQVDSMFDQFRSAKAIIFDMRGSPHGTTWTIAPRLTPQQDVPAAIFTGPLCLNPDLPNAGALISTASYFYVQKIPQTEKWKYSGKTVMLIDERTMSQAEHTGLLFEAANKTEFIGTSSAGADGDVTNFVVPGGVTIFFSGHDVRHANGGQLQRLGLQPSVTVAPTIEGTRSGRDEILQKAIEYLSDETGTRIALRRRTAK